ncbi:hypothetical protein D3C85_893230 [compost metagenome]
MADERHVCNLLTAREQVTEMVCPISDTCGIPDCRRINTGTHVELGPLIFELEPH